MKIHNLGLDSSGRPLRVDDRTLAKLRHAEAQLGFTFTIVQGSYRGSSGAAASAGTHDKGGVVDLRSWNLPASISPQNAVLHLRRAGLIAWYRTKAQGFDPHFHVIDYGNPELSPSAARQVTAWQNGRNGLASNGRDDGPRINIPKAVPKEDDMANYAEQLKSIEDKLDHNIAQNETTNRRLNRLLDGDKGIRHQLTNLRKRLSGENAAMVDDILAAIDQEGD